MTDMRLRWRFFWAQRSGARTVWALVYALFALTASVYLALPAESQRQTVSMIQGMGQAVGSEGLTIALEIALAVFAAISFALLLAPGYRQYRYLTIPTSVIAPISVYVDAENVHDVRRTVAYLRKFLDGRRADLLYFADAGETAYSEKYKLFYRFGFRVVDVPHNPIGTKSMYEAVDRELAMHAFERAMLGPSHQEFILITSDGDFVPLIYRIMGLGHKVHVWSESNKYTYAELTKYLPVTLVNLSEVFAEQGIEPPSDVVQAAPLAPQQQQPSPQQGAVHTNRNTKRNNQSRSARRTVHSTPTSSIALPASLQEPGQDSLYYAIVETLQVRQECENRAKSDGERVTQFRSVLSSRQQPRMASIGYRAGAWLDMWIDELTALDILAANPGQDFAAVGKEPAESAARRLYAMARSVAQAASQAKSSRPDGNITMQDILTELETFDSVKDSAGPLAVCVSRTNPRATMHIRYFLRCARALHLIEFDDSPSTLDRIANPHLIVSQEPDAEPSDADEPDTSANA